MSDNDEMKTLLVKSTVSQLKEQCTQRSLPVTPAKKSDLVSRLAKYLKDHPEDELSKIAHSNDEEEEEAEEEEEVKETPVDGAEEKSVGQTDATSDEAEAKEETELEESTEQDMETEGQKDSDTKTSDIEKEKETEEAKDEVKDAEEEDKGNEEKDKEEAMDYSEFIVIDDSETAEGKDGKNEDKKKDKGDEKNKGKTALMKRPRTPDSNDLIRYLYLEQRTRTLSISPLTVEDLTGEELKKLLTGDMENVHFYFTTEFPETPIGHLHVVYKTVDETNAKFDEFAGFKEGVSVKKLADEMLISRVYKEDTCSLLEDMRRKYSTDKQVPLDRRTICAHFVPEGTSEEHLRSLFPEAKSFLWARDENGKYDGKVFMHYEDDNKSLEEWHRIRKEKILIEETRLWFHTVSVIDRYDKGLSSPLLSNEKRRQLNTRRKQLVREIEIRTLSRETADNLQQDRRKIDEVLYIDREERNRIKEQERKEELKKKEEEERLRKEKGEEAPAEKDTKSDDKESAKEGSSEKGTKSAEKGSKSKTDGKGSDHGKKSDNQEKKTSKRPHASSRWKQQQQQRRVSQNRPERYRRSNYAPQRSPGYDRRPDRVGPGYQRVGLGASQRSPMPQANLGGMRMNQGFGQQGMGLPVTPQLNPQATANAVNLLVGLSSILGGNMRRQTGGDSVQGYGGNFQQGGYHNERGQWVGGFSEEPLAKRSRFSGGRRH